MAKKEKPLPSQSLCGSVEIPSVYVVRFHIIGAGHRYTDSEKCVCVCVVSGTYV